MRGPPLRNERTDKRPRIKTTRGRLTAYGFACGYIEVRGGIGGVRTTLWQEHGVYHVRQHDFKTRGRVFWDVFRPGEIGKARHRFDNAVKEAACTT